jgi:hypothetical protein
MRTPVEGTVEGYDCVPAFAVFILAVFPGGFNKPFVGFCAGIGEEHPGFFPKPRNFAQPLRKHPARLRVVQIGHVRQFPGLRGNCRDPFGPKGGSPFPLQMKPGNGDK